MPSRAGAKNFIYGFVHRRTAACAPSAAVAVGLCAPRPKNSIRVNRKDAGFTDHNTSEEEDQEYWSKASIEDKAQMITYLRECYYGPEATTRRLQRFFAFVKQA